MDNSSSSNINTIPVADSEKEPQTPSLPLKKAWNVGSNIVTVIDKSLVKRLGINEDNTLFQQQIVEDGILLRIIRKETQL